MVEPEKMPVHPPPRPVAAKVDRPFIHMPKLNVPRINRTDPFPKDCGVQPPEALRLHYVQAARRYRDGATACELAMQGFWESGFRTMAVSPVGAIGVAQFLPHVAEEQGVDPWDARSSIFGQARYVRWCRARWLKDYGREEYDIRALGLGCYNWGLGNMRKDQERNGWLLYGEAEPHMPKETREYVRKIEGK